MQEAHSDQIPIECQICKIWLPDATALQPHLQWHGDPNRSLIPHRYAEECANCHMFLAHGRESSNHCAFCVRKLDPDIRDCRQASGTPEPAVVTHQGRDNAPTRTLRQIVREILRDTTHSNAATMCQTAATNPCPASMSHKTEPDEQEIEIISGDSRYWEQFEEEVQYNSRRNNITASPPTIPSETSDQPPGEYSGTGENNSCGSPSVGHSGEYIEEEFKNPMLEAHETGVPLDLSVGPEAQSSHPDCPGDSTAGCAGHTNKQYLVSEDYLKEVERIKERVVQDLVVFTKDKEWKCKECEIIFISPLRVRKHIIAKHFSGPMCCCKYCGIYSKNEVSLQKHLSRRHKVETDKECSQWQITKHQAKAARSSQRSCPTPDYPPAPPPSLLKVASEQHGSNDKPAD